MNNWVWDKRHPMRICQKLKETLLGESPAFFQGVLPFVSSRKAWKINPNHILRKLIEASR